MSGSPFDRDMPKLRDVLDMMKSTGAVPHQIFEISTEGHLTCHGYTVDEVVLLLESYRTHMREFMTIMTGFQSAADAVLYTPQGPEDIV